MEWYYAENGQQVGPVTDADVERLVQEGRITPQTLVWHEGMPSWQPYSQAPAEPSPAEPDTDSGQWPCAECGRLFSPDDVIRLEGQLFCAGCKPVALQKLREGLALPGTFQYAGFWIRVVAKFADWCILFVVNLIVGGIVTFLVGAVMSQTEGGILGMFLGPLLNFLAQIGVGVAYATYFIGRHGATLGKMACGLKVIRSDGNRVSYPRALGRYFAEMLSGLTLGIGYVIAAFDEEKRSLHDHICDTRVIRK